MRGCSAGPVKQILVGLQRIGIMKLSDSLQRTVEEGLHDRESIIDYLMKEVERENYISDPQDEQFRRALWREFKRFKGEDIRHLFSPIDVVIQGDPGKERDAFEKILRQVFGEFELRPLVTYRSAARGEPTPQLVIDDNPVISGSVTFRQFKLTIRKYISHW